MHAAPTARRIRGATLIEMLVAMTLASLASMLVMQGTRPLVAALALEASRLSLIDALLEARRVAYEQEATTFVQAQPASGEVGLFPGGRRRPLTSGVTVASAPSDGRVEFRASGLADNATITLTNGAATAVVVVNQRGNIR